MTLAIDPNSRFGLTESVRRDNIETFGLLKKFSFLNPANVGEENIELIEVTQAQAGKPWLIADLLYNVPTLDWVIVLFNRPLNPVNWPAVGEVIRAPIAAIVLPNV